jgi:hypothetical protein
MSLLKTIFGGESKATFQEDVIEGPPQKDLSCGHRASSYATSVRTNETACTSCYHSKLEKGQF